MKTIILALLSTAFVAAAEPNLQYNAGRAVIRCESTDFIHWTSEKGDLVMANDAQDRNL